MWCVVCVLSAQLDLSGAGRPVGGVQDHEPVLTYWRLLRRLVARRNLILEVLTVILMVVKACMFLAQRHGLVRERCQGGGGGKVKEREREIICPFSQIFTPPFHHDPTPLLRLLLLFFQISPPF